MEHNGRNAGTTGVVGDVAAPGLGVSVWRWTSPRRYGSQNRGKTMVDPMSTDDGVESSGTKPNFVGRIVKSEKESTDFPMKEEYKQEGEDYYELLYEVEPLDKDWKNLREFSVKINGNFNSKWMLLIGHLQSIHGNLKDHDVTSAEDLGPFLTGRVYEFREVDFSEDEEFTYPGAGKTVVFNQMFRNSSSPPNPFLLPVREITDEDELMDLTGSPESDETEIEEVNI